MIAPDNRILRFVATLALCLAGSAMAWALNPSQPPSGNFDLSHWKLQLPTSNGVLTASGGTVDEVKPAQLAGFTNTYFYTGSDGAMVFWTPDNGARTSGSDHPRSELREELIPGNDNTNWTVYGTHILTAQCKVLQVASDTEKVCIGQMHEPNTKPDGSPSAGNEQMIMFDLGNQKIYVNINLDGNLSSSFSQTLISGSGVVLSNAINYTMSVVNGGLTIVVNNITNSWNLLSGTNYQGHIAQNWDTSSSNTLYFKAGDYNQTTNQCNCATDGARVAFYALSRYHAPSITNQPASQIVSVGSNVTFSVGVLGNPPLTYTWQLNNISINKATNATLTIPNVQLTNAGNYSVIVTDITGNVTSSNASLTVLSPAPVADFTATPTNGVVPLNVSFTDTSSNSPTSWSWTFGDTGTSTSQSPSHTYTTPGTYTVTLIASNTGGSSTNTKVNLITALTPPPVASFTASPTNGAAPLGVSFADTSSGSITGWAWVFGDGNTSIGQNPSDVYVNPGTYAVQEIVSGPGGSSTNTQTALISVYDSFAWWRLQYFGSTNNNANTAPDGDYTGTGMSNTNKFLAGFNPTNPAAYLHIISIANTNAADINVVYVGANGDSTWSPGIASRTNVLEFTPGTADGGYSSNFVSANVTNILSGGTGTGLVTNMVDVGGATNTPARYYRVRVLVP